MLNPATMQTTPARAAPAASAQLPLGGIATLGRLFDTIYEGPTETPPWHSALELLREALEAKHVTLILRPPSPQSDGVILNTDTIDAEGARSYQTHFFALDPFVGLPDGEIVSPQDLLGARWSETALYREYLRPFDVEHLVGADITTADGIECRFRVSRGRDMRPFDAEDRALCRLLLPHLRRAIQLHARLDGLECERQLFAGVVNRLQLGIVGFARSGAIVELNDEARRVLAASDGLRLAGQTLAFDSRTEAREFQRMLREAIGDAPQATPALVDAMSVTRPSGRSPIGLLVRRVAAAAWPKNPQLPVAAVFLRDPESGTQRLSRDVVQRLFGFTHMEAGLALAIADGLTLEEAAERLGIKKNTARTYLRFIFCKTGVSRQSQLIRRLLGNVVALA
ncbi:MAG: helix-turn-helix transcriptional regulator [Gammaproteobacteria bacterium]